VEYFGYIVRYLLRHRDVGDEFLVRAADPEGLSSLYGPVYPLYLCNPQTRVPSAEQCQYVESVGLLADFYKGDRSMRESGFDISFRFGPFSGATHHYAAVGLNSLLYKTETDLERMSRLLDREAEADGWHARARARQHKMQEYFWDDQRGLFFDYDFKKRARSSFTYLTTFYPLWVGAASPTQAGAIVRNLSLFEQPGGLAMSREETKTQWDYPYGWAPVHLIAAEGLRRYGYEEEADRISFKFLSTVVENFRRDGTIREKYNVVTRSSETQVEAGYKENVIGFGWTNGVFLELLDELPREWVSRLSKQ
jgi:alpha,alpha-trehalase